MKEIKPLLEDARKHRFGARWTSGAAEVPHQEAAIPITDHVRPMEDDVEEVVKLVRALPSQVWIHVHCRKGIGRTGTLLTVLSILRDTGGDTSAQELATRCGAAHLFESAELSELPPHKAYKYELKKDRREFLERFLIYVRSKELVGWSTWIRRKPEVTAPPA